MIKNEQALKDILSAIRVGGEEITLKKLTEIATSKEEIEVEVIDLISDDDIAELRKKSEKKGYDEGVIAGEEMTTKKIKKHFGVEVEGRDFDKIAGTIKETIINEAKLPVEEKVSQLSESLERLRKTHELEIGQFKSENEALKTEKRNMRRDAYIAQNLPKIDGLKPSHLVAMLKADGIGVDFTEDETQAFPTKNGKPVLDKLEKNVSFEVVVNEWVAANGLGIAPGRNPGAPPPAQGFKSHRDAMKYLEENDIDPRSEEADKILASVGA